MAAKFPKKRSIPGYTDGFATTAPVMSFSPNRFGLYDLSGNIWEFCQDWYDETRTKYVIRGLNFDDSGESSVRFLSSHRGWCPVGNRHSNFGFRLVLERAAKRAADGGAAAVSSASSSAPPTDPMTWTDLRDSFNAARETRAALPTGPTTWTDTKGRSLTATFKAIASGNVLLDIAGKTTPVPLNTLSAESQKLAQQMDAARQRAEASDPAKATKDQPFVNSLGMKFVPVPITGGSTGGKRVLFSIWETRVQDYEVFVQDTRRAWGSPEFPQGPTHPAVMVSWADARAFAEWLTARERQAGKSPASTVYRLPTDHEWSCAAGIGDLEQADLIPEEKFQGLPGIYPWGQQWPPPSGAGNFWSEELRPLVGQPGFNHFKGELPGYKDGAAATAAVGSYLPNALGLYDVSGNVWEWCEDWFNPQQRYKVQRGGSWNGNNEDGMLTSHRHTRPPQEAPNGVGFRLVLELDAKPASASPAVPVIPSSTSTATRNSPEMTALLEFERKLRSHTWVIPDRNWELRFENNHRAPIDEKVYTTRWHWWITGPRSLHVQFAAAPAAYDPNIGAEYIFDKNMKGFTNGAGKPTGVRGSALAAPAESDLGRSLAPDYAPKLRGGLPSQFPSL
jgi:formylglycine-generating enzyme required for sulfatase activity